MPISSVAMFRRVMASSLRQNHHPSSTSVATTARDLVGGRPPSTIANFPRLLTTSSHRSPESPGALKDSSSANTTWTNTKPSFSATSNTISNTTTTKTTITTATIASNPPPPPSTTSPTTTNKKDLIKPKASNPLPPFHVQFEEQSQLQYHERHQQKQRQRQRQKRQKHRKYHGNYPFKNQHSHHNTNHRNQSPHHDPQRASNNPYNNHPPNRPYEQHAPPNQQQQQQRRRPSNHTPRHHKNHRHHAANGGGGYNNPYPGNPNHPRPPPQQQPKRLLVAQDVFPQSSYVELKNIPILSSLEDVVRTVNQVLDIEKERGIVDLDALEQQLATKATAPIVSGQGDTKESMDQHDNTTTEETPLPPPPIPNSLPLLQFDEHENDHNADQETYQDYAQTKEVNIRQEQQEQHKRWIVSAKSILSTKYRPTGWKLQFANRSIVHALLTHAKENTIFCAWKPIQVEEWRNNSGTTRGSHAANDNYKRRVPRHSSPTPSMTTTVSSDSIQISDSMVRIENCPRGMTIDHLRHVLRRYDLSLQDTPSIIKLTESTGGGDSFLVKFEDSTWARAAIREMQGVAIQPKHALRFCQYPQQLL
mmetsp:Transcript_30039/g.46073  ORF Transcript_30039/g.46073 Transcript_30039/m.46073 type:complete len:591 (+) Transcript_30039:84-1856(+)